MAAELDVSFRSIKGNEASKNIHINQKFNLCQSVYFH